MPIAAQILNQYGSLEFCPPKRYSGLRPVRQRVSNPLLSATTVTQRSKTPLGAQLGSLCSAAKANNSAACHCVSTGSRGTGLPRMRETRMVPRRQTRRAQANSLARIAKPSGTMIIAGPGKTIITSPINTTLKPIVPMRNRRKRGRDSSPKRATHF